MEHWDHVDYLPVGWNESEDLTGKVEEDDINLELIINVYTDQYRPQEPFILDDVSLDDMIPSGDDYKDQLEQTERQALGKMFHDRMP